MTRVDDTMLMAYVDGEVDAATAREIETAMASDTSLQARAQRLRESAAFARGAFADVLHDPVPDRLVAAINRASRPAGTVVPLVRTQRTVTRTMVGWAMAASVAALVVGYGVGTMNTGVTPRQEGIQLASSDRWLDHVAGFYDVYAKSLATQDRLLVDFNAEDVPELEKWFGAKLNRKLAVPDLSSQGLAAQGGRLLIINGKPAAQFLYYSTTGELVGLVIAFTDAPYMPARTEQRGDVNIVHWRNNGYAYAFVGKSDPARLQQIAASVWRDLERAS